MVSVAALSTGCSAEHRDFPAVSNDCPAEHRDLDCSGSNIATAAAEERGCFESNIERRTGE